jgi:hypothetical protein
VKTENEPDDYLLALSDTIAAMGELEEAIREAATEIKTGLMAFGAGDPRQ